jgi:hypothetical protein
MSKVNFEARTHLVLSLHLGIRACVCRTNGVLGRGPIAYDSTGRYGVGGRTFTVGEVTSLTIERDLVTVHLGDIA